MTDKFKIGDRCETKFWGGIVYCTIVGKHHDGNHYAISVDKFRHGTHDCDGLAKIGHGYYLAEKDLELTDHI